MCKLVAQVAWSPWSPTSCLFEGRMVRCAGGKGRAACGRNSMRGKRGSMQEQKLRTPCIWISIKCMLLLMLMASSIDGEDRWGRIEKVGGWAVYGLAARAMLILNNFGFTDHYPWSHLSLCLSLTLRFLGMCHFSIFSSDFNNVTLTPPTTRTRKGCINME